MTANNELGGGWDQQRETERLAPQVRSQGGALFGAPPATLAHKAGCPSLDPDSDIETEGGWLAARCTCRPRSPQPTLRALEELRATLAEMPTPLLPVPFRGWQVLGRDAVLQAVDDAIKAQQAGRAHRG